MIRPEKLGDAIAEHLEKLILEGVLRPGERLASERDLALKLDVSRPSLREALEKLQNKGLIETSKGGTVVAQFLAPLSRPLAELFADKPRVTSDYFEYRRIIEGQAAALAATRATDEDFADLQRILDAQRRKLKKGQSAIVEDTAFHAALARSTRNRVVVSLMATLNDLLVESRTLSLKQKGRPAKSIEGHEAVVAALRLRDAEGAARAMSDHIDQIADLQLHAPELRGDAAK